MAKTNIVVINSEQANSTMAFDNPKSLIQFVGAFLDQVDDWTISCEVILVHRNGQVIRQTLLKVTNLIDFFQGYCSALWLSDDNAARPVLEWDAWANLTTISKVYDSRESN